MIEFELWCDGTRESRKLYINPAEVAAVTEGEERRAYGGWNPTATITLRCGTSYTVHDGARAAARKITQAQAAAAHEGERR